MKIVNRVYRDVIVNRDECKPWNVTPCCSQIMWYQSTTRKSHGTYSPHTSIIWYHDLHFITWLAIKDRLATWAKWEVGEFISHAYFVVKLKKREVISSWLDYWRRPGLGWNGSEYHYSLHIDQTTLHTFSFVWYQRAPFQTTIYYIWRARNERRHKQLYHSTSHLVRIIEKLVRNQIVSIRDSLYTSWAPPKVVSCLRISVVGLIICISRFVHKLFLLINKLNISTSIKNSKIDRVAM